MLKNNNNNEITFYEQLVWRKKVVAKESPVYRRDKQTKLIQILEANPRVYRALLIEQIYLPAERDINYVNICK